MNNKTNEQTTRKKIAFVAAISPCQNLYSVERIATLAKMFANEEIYVLLKQDEVALELLHNAGLEVITYQSEKQLQSELFKIKPDLLIRDSGDTEREDVEKLTECIPSIVHFDDFGEGGHVADCVLQTLYQETRERLLPHYLTGPSSFVVPENLTTVTSSFDVDTDRPHIVVAIEGSDADNSTYRILRHLMQLQVPIRISVLVDLYYAHDVDELKMMALSRRNIRVIQQNHLLPNLLSEAQIVICGAKYTPYKVASIGVPCIVISQNEQELLHIFPRDTSGFIHLGTGRKLKQSLLQNAVMELLLHEARRGKAVQKQLQSDLQSNNDYIYSMLRNFVQSTPKTEPILAEEQANKASRMIQ